MPGNQQEVQGNSAQSRVLVVDDDPGVRHTIQWALEDDGLQVETACDGREALERVASSKPALMVLDIGLPTLDGYGVAQGLREREADVPILVITADGRAAEKAKRVGAVDYLHKPFDVEDLVDRVRNALAS